MQLEEIRKLPQKVVENLDGDIGNLKVYLVQDYDLQFLKRMVTFGLGIFGDLGMDEWGLVPQVRHGNVFVLKEEDKKRLIGIAILMRDWEDTDMCYLFDYAIAEDFQGQGLGYHFLISICKNLFEQGFKSMSLTVDTENVPAIKLYEEKMGFEIAEHRKDEYGKGHDRYIMKLDLNKFKKL
ncbi:GNAT family N-acetyltransferase [Acidaminobacter hydrogenoformans]|uniref:Ribosomal-protein-alanine N-acetyltransferase n=1 Tax=Acidaminobacter hydrogenoformans DSM 2784 TaxID=1120920 RepID=A0A1G5RW43_9FIRM|nr:GNAT family N-acetyltransferase [Acidaminobacter hydrogenoformans]SCZ77661.1 ribosomal-protein-alanine N-acetyltransferase [Acidaminobacter hydrogenoformans DSM 2784]